MSSVPPTHMLREEDEDAVDPDSRTDNDGKRHHEAEFYSGDKVGLRAKRYLSLPTCTHGDVAVRRINTATRTQ